MDGLRFLQTRPPKEIVLCYQMTSGARAFIVLARKASRFAFPFCLSSRSLCFFAVVAPPPWVAGGGWDAGGEHIARLKG